MDLTLTGRRTSYREGCAYAREKAITRLRALDDELLRCKPSGWTVLGFRERTMVTRFGDVVVSRRMYRDSDGGTVFALDECLGWRPRQLASPSLTEWCGGDGDGDAVQEGVRYGERTDCRGTVVEDGSPGCYRVWERRRWQRSVSDGSLSSSVERM